MELPPYCGATFPQALTIGIPRQKGFNGARRRKIGGDGGGRTTRECYDVVNIDKVEVEGVMNPVGIATPSTGRITEGRVDANGTENTHTRIAVFSKNMSSQVDSLESRSPTDRTDVTSRRFVRLL